MPLSVVSRYDTMTNLRVEGFHEIKQFVLLFRQANSAGRVAML